MGIEELIECFHQAPKITQERILHLLRNHDLIRTIAEQSKGMLEKDIPEFVVASVENHMARNIGAANYV